MPAEVAISSGFRHPGNPRVVAYPSQSIEVKSGYLDATSETEKPGSTAPCPSKSPKRPRSGRSRGDELASLAMKLRGFRKVCNLNLLFGNCPPWVQPWFLDVLYLLPPSFQHVGHEPQNHQNLLQNCQKGTPPPPPPGGGVPFGNFSRLRYMETFSTWTGLIHGKAIGIEQQKDCQQKNLGHHKHIHHNAGFSFCFI